MKASEFVNQMQEFKNPMKAFALNLTKDYDNAQDLIQETYFRAISNKDKYAEGTNLKAWLLTIMKNIFINNYRRKVKRNTIIDSTDNLYLINSSQTIEGNTAERNLIMEDLNKAVKSLSVEYKIPFIKHFEGYKYQEIAEELNLPLGTVKSRIFFARKQIKENLEKIGFQR